MALSTTTLALSAVTAEIPLTQNSLQDCVDDASAGDFDGTYYTSPATSLKEFRGYETGGGVTYYTFDASSNEPSTADACAITSLNNTFYSTTTEFNNEIPDVGDLVFSDTSGTDLPAGYYKTVTGGLDQTITVSPAGVVDATVVCK